MRPITLLTGPNDTFKREHLAALLKDIPRDGITTYYADEYENDPERLAIIFSQCRESGLFGGHNVVIVKKERKDKEDRGETAFSAAFIQALEKYIAQANPDTVLILCAEKIELDDAIAGKYADRIEEKEFKQLYEKDIVQYAARRLRESGVRFDPDLPDFLLSLTGKDAGQMEMVLGIVLNYAGQKGEVTVAEARGLLARSHNMDVYDLVDGIFTRNAQKSIHSLHDLRLAGKEPIAINGALLSTARSLWGYLATKSNSTRGRDYFLSQYARKVDLKFVSSVMDLVKRVELKARSVHADFVFLEFEKFILSMRD